MSKYTKVIAALGVAAGLGVASLPFGAFAATYVDGEVEVSTTVPDVLSMIIDTDSNSTDAVDGGIHIDGTDISKITIGTDGKIEAGKHGVSAKKTTVKITTNMPNGYDFTVVGTDLIHQGVDTAKQTEAAYRITPFATAATTAEDGSATEGWGINVTLKSAKTTSDNADIDDYAITGAGKYSVSGKYFMPNADSAAADKSIDTVANDAVTAERQVVYEIEYAANIKAGKPAGEYKGTATYTATAR